MENNSDFIIQLRRLIQSTLFYPLHFVLFVAFTCSAVSAFCSTGWARASHEIALINALTTDNVGTLAAFEKEDDAEDASQPDGTLSGRCSCAGISSR